jgi:hypothetical protein
MIIGYVEIGLELTGVLKEFHARQKVGLETILIDMSNFVLSQKVQHDYSNPKVRNAAWNAFCKRKGDIHYLTQIEMEFAKMIFFIVLDKHLQALGANNEQPKSG